MASINASDIYFGTYARFETPDKNTGSVLASGDTLIGDVGEIIIRYDDENNPIAWLKNPYGEVFGYLPEALSYKIAIFQAKGWKTQYVMSVCMYSDAPAPGLYWGQVALCAWAMRYDEAFSAWLKIFAERMGEGLRPDPNLGTPVVEGILQDPRSWKPGAKVKMPTGSGHTAVVKDHRTPHDKLLDQARAGNKGCYIIGYGFIAALVVFIVWWLHNMGLF